MTEKVYYPLCGPGGPAEEMSEGEYQLAYGAQEGPGDEEYLDGEEYLDVVCEGRYPRTLEVAEGSWQKADGAILALEAMSDGHVLNCILWMRRRGFDGHPKFFELVDEKNRRGLK